MPKKQRKNEKASLALRKYQKVNKRLRNYKKMSQIKKRMKDEVWEIIEEIKR